MGDTDPSTEKKIETPQPINTSSDSDNSSKKRNSNDLQIVDVDKIDIESQEIVVSPAAPNNQIIPPPRTPMTPGSRVPLAPKTPMLGEENRPETATKPKSQFERLKTVAYIQIAKTRPKIYNFFKAIYKSSFAVILTRIDWWLEKNFSHKNRYFGFLVIFQLFPLIFFIFRAKPTIRRKCDEPLDTYIIGSGILCFIRIVLGYFVMRRIDSRDWVGQSFGEALGQIWNLVEKQGSVDTSLLRGIRLNVAITIVVLTDMGFWLFGFITVCASISALCADRMTSDAVAVVVYQFFNIFFMSAYLDVVMPYFYLEFDPDVDVMVAGQKNSSGDTKRKMKIAMEKKARDAERQKQRERRRLGQKAPTQVIQVAPSSKADASSSSSSKAGSQGGNSDGVEGNRPETAWWSAEEGIPPRKQIVTNKKKVVPETNDEGEDDQSQSKKKKKKERKKLKDRPN